MPGIHLNNIRAVKGKSAENLEIGQGDRQKKGKKIVGGGEKVEKKEGIRKRERGRGKGKREEERGKKSWKEEGGGTKSMACFSGPWLLEVMGV